MDDSSIVAVPNWVWALITALLFSVGGLLVTVLHALARSIKESVSQLAATVQRHDDRLRSVEVEVRVLQERRASEVTGHAKPRAAAGM